MLDAHRVSLAYLDMMAEGDSDPATVEQLKQANRSRQLVLLRAVLDRSRTLECVTTPLSPLDEAWSLLAEAQRRDEAAVDAIITHPQTGLWTAKLLRLLNLGRTADDEPPLWASLGYLHQMAVAAAVRADLEFAVWVPVWRGTINLPTIGVVTIPKGEDEWSVALVRSKSHNVVVHGAAGTTRLPRNWSVDGPGWLAQRTLHGDGYELGFDDIDPYREFDRLLEPQRLSATERNRWSRSLQETWRLLTEHHPATAAELASGLTNLVPSVATEQWTPYSASHNDAFGSVVLSRPPDATTFAATLVHEFQHSKLGVLLSLVDLLDPQEDNETPRLYAPWRDDPRPPLGVLHGVFSFLGVAGFYRSQSIVESGLSARVAQFEFDYHREQTLQAAETLVAEAALSALGRRFLNRTCARLRFWAAEPLPKDVREAARRANTDHHLSWRIRHLQPPEATVVELASAWQGKSSKPLVPSTEPRLAPSGRASTHARLVLTRTWLSKPDRYDHYHSDPDSLATETNGATTADLALLDGRLDVAVARYRRQILAHPDSVAAWAGLALASEDKTLLTQPELVFSVHQKIRARSGKATDPLRLAEWLG